MFPLGERLYRLGRCIYEEAAARKEIASKDVDKIRESEKRVRLFLSDAIKYILNYAPIEIMTATGGILTPPDKRLVRLMAIVLYDQLEGHAEHPTVAECGRLCAEPHADRDSEFFRIRSAAAELTYAQFYSASKVPLANGDAVIRLNHCLLTMLGGGIISGTVSMRAKNSTE